ncbi:MAG: hypothetical protein ACRD2I_12150 [Vicinamibacterales bacterium]
MDVLNSSRERHPFAKERLRESLSLNAQWFLNNNPIGGATSKTYIATATGSYTALSR